MVINKRLKLQIPGTCNLTDITASFYHFKSPAIINHVIAFSYPLIELIDCDCCY